jgi:formyltetrahydrofolate hydrolase
LLVCCPDRTGLVAALSDFVFRNGGNILDLDQHTDPESAQCFMRLRWGLQDFALDRTHTRLGLDVLAQRYALRWELRTSDERSRVAVFATKLDQGPIIEQNVCRVSHRDDVEQLMQKGRELKRQVLTRAVRLDLERRVIIHGDRTVVLG